jgi:hypothetical protein
MVKNICGVVNRSARPEKSFLKSSLRASRSSWLQHPQNPAGMYHDLFEVINAFEQPLIPELTPVEFPLSVVPIREAIKDMWASRYGAYFSQCEFTPQELAAGSPLTLPSATNNPSFYPTLWSENRLFDHLDYMWDGSTPSALVTHPYVGPFIGEAFTEAGHELCDFGLGFAEAAWLPSWQWPPWTGMLLVVRLGDKHFKHIKTLQHLLHYLNRQQRLTPVPNRLHRYLRHFKP